MSVGSTSEYGSGVSSAEAIQLEDVPVPTGLACPLCHKLIATIARVTPRGVLFVCPTCGLSLGGMTISY